MTTRSCGDYLAQEARGKRGRERGTLWCRIGIRIITVGGSAIIPTSFRSTAYDGPHLQIINDRLRKSDYMAGREGEGLAIKRE
jgi:hypothetical protein